MLKVLQIDRVPSDSSAPAGENVFAVVPVTWMNVHCSDVAPCAARLSAGASTASGRCCAAQVCCNAAVPALLTVAAAAFTGARDAPIGLAGRPATACLGARSRALRLHATRCAGAVLTKRIAESGRRTPLHRCCRT